MMIDLKEDLLETAAERYKAAASSRHSALAGNQYFLFILRLILAAVFIYAAVQKIGKPLMFADEIKMYGILDRGPLLYMLAIVLPWIEILCGLSLLSGLLVRGSALILTLLNAVFIVVISYRTAGLMNSMGTPFKEVFFDCGCGLGATYAWKKLIEDLLLFVCALLVFLAPSYRFVVFQRNR